MEIAKNKLKSFVFEQNVAEIYVREDPSDYAIVRYFGYDGYDDCANSLKQPAPGLGFERLYI